MVCAGGVHGSSGAGEWEGRSIKISTDAFEQARASTWNRGSMERTKPSSRRLDVNADELGKFSWSLVVEVEELRALGKRGEGTWAWMGGVAFPLATHHVTMRRAGERGVHACWEGTHSKKEGGGDRRAQRPSEPIPVHFSTGLC